MINIIIPMAGNGKRFQDSGILTPKPLIKIFDKTMIEIVIENLRPSIDHRFIFICQKEHIEKYNLKQILFDSAPNCTIILTDKVTEGAACTALLAKQYINNDYPLIIANCDQYIHYNVDEYYDFIKDQSGVIMTMNVQNDTKWSYVKNDEHGFVKRVAEKEAISNEATVGVYHFGKGRYFVEASESMIRKNIRTNNEFYVAPAYNEMIENNINIISYNIGDLKDKMIGLGTPEDLHHAIGDGNLFLKNTLNSLQN